MARDHDHHAHGDHHHAPTTFARAFAIGILLNLGFVAIEAFYGWQVNSLALLADAAPVNASLNPLYLRETDAKPMAAAPSP